MLENEGKYSITPITIALVGPHYSGKTTLTRLLHQRLDFVSVEECWEKNPYLNNQQNNPLQNQVWYLQQAVENILKAKELNKRGQGVILDTFVYSTFIFSKIFLTDRDFQAFCQLFNSLVPNLPVPDLLVYLKASTDFLYNKRRIARINEGKAPETDLTVSYDWLDRSRLLHDCFFTLWKQSPVVIVDVEKKDLLHNNSEFEDFISDVQTGLKQNGG